MKSYFKKIISLLVTFFIIISATFIVAGVFKNQNKIEPKKADVAPYSSMVQLIGDPQSELLGASTIQQTDLKSKDINSDVSYDKEETSTQRPHKENESSVAENLSGIDGGDGGGHHDENKDNIENQSDDGEKESEYFFTSIVNNEVVTVEKYSFTITQKNQTLLVKNINVSVNGVSTGEFDGSVKLKSGNNTIAIMVTYTGQDGESFTIIQKYCVVYEKNGIVIYTDIKNNIEVQKKRFSFKAWAMQKGEEVPVTVLLNNIELQTLGNDLYMGELDGKINEIQITASNSSGQKTERYTVFLNEDNNLIIFNTDLYDHEVNEQEYDFKASAECNGGKIACSVIQDDTVLAVNSKDEYKAELKEGKNVFTLAASSGSNHKKEIYTITYIKKVSGGGDENDPVEDEKLKPTIYTDLKDSETVSGKIKNIEVHAKDYKGNYIESTSISVYCNGQSAQLIWANLEQISYRLSLSDGDNIIKIQAMDKEGHEAVKSYTIYCKPAEEGEILGTATISIEATTIGMGYIIPPQEVQIEEGKNGAYILDELLHKCGYDYQFTGTLNSGFYLSRILFNKNIVKPNVPEDLAKHCQEEADYFDTDDYYCDSLGEFDICNGSGWMFSVNGVYPNYGFSDLYMKPGDVVRIRYTLYYGKDIGGGSAMGDGGGNWEKEW